MRYRIGILERDNQYLERLTKFLKTHHGDSLEVDTADGSPSDWTDVVPELLGMEVSEYDALLIGDDIDVMEESLPAGLRLAYLTADAVQDSSYEISKYQRLEQIYQQIIAVCEMPEAAEEEPEGQEPEEQGGSAEEFGPVLFTENEDGDCYRVYRLSDGEDMDACSVEMKMLANNKIPGLAEVRCGEGEVRYNITGKVCLMQFAMQNQGVRGRNKLLRILRGILDTLLGMEEYMLVPDRVLLVPEEIYIDPASMETALLYLPFWHAGIGQDIKECVRCMVEGGRRILTGLGETLPADDLQDGYDREPEEQPLHTGQTAIFSTLQQAAEERMELKRRITLSELPSTPYLVRKKTGERIPVNKNSFKIGKDENSVDYCIRNNPTVSRSHADIVKKPDGFYIVDKGSLNHTFLNGRVVDPKRARKLKKGDLIQIANEIFTFHLKDE